MSEESAAATKHAIISDRVTDFKATVEHVLTLAPPMDKPSADPQAEYLQALAVIAEVSRLCEQYRDLIAAAAHRGPNPLSISRIAETTGLSVNTVRSKLPSIKQGRVEVDRPPF